MKKILLLPFTLLASIVGQFSWTAPPWLTVLYEHIKNNRMSSIFVLAIVGAGFGGYLYYGTLPKPVMIQAVLDNIEVTPNYDGAKPDNLDIRFQYDFSQLNDNQVRPVGEPSVARIDLVGNEVPIGIRLSPAKKGKWRWLDDRTLRFVPENDWPAGTEYTVVFDPSIFVTEATLSSEAYRMSTPEMTADFSQVEFYQDPLDISVRRVVTTLKFSHPVNQEQLQQSLSMGMRPSREALSGALKPYKFSINFDKRFREAYIQSEPVLLPNKPNYMKVTLSKGVSSLLGGTSIDSEVDTKILIPDIYSFLEGNSSSQIVRNQKNEPEQMIMLEFTDDINEQELLSKLNIFLLPKTGERSGKNYWKSPREVNENILASSRKISFTTIANEKKHSKIYNLKIDVPENRYVYIKIDKGLTSVNKYVHASFYDDIVRSPRYPKEVNIAGEGSVLTYSGNHELSISTRGVPGLKYTFGRVLPGQLYHLISQTNGDITDPNFNNWNFGKQNLAEFESQLVPLKRTHPKDTNYSSIDLTDYLPKKENQFGLFFVDVQGFDFSRKRVIYEASDKRLVLITDLGIIVKNNADRTHDVFVQSITNGLPVANARVELLGKNGVPVFSGVTNDSGRVSIPATNHMSNEQKPTVYIVTSNGDLSFIPFDRRSRQINLSRFDIGGVRPNQNNRDALNAFLFSDRGIYRPGEKINIGLIVKAPGLSNIENIPLEIVVRGPRNKELKIKKYKLSKMGFDEFQYPTELTSDTGRYTISLHLVRDGRYRGREIGTTQIRLEEFQPDTMKIESKLLDVVNKGWNNQEKIKTKVTLRNLFGTPAQDKKVSARLRIKPHNFQFKRYQEYKFTDPYFDQNQRPLSLDSNLEKKQTNADGVAEFDLDLAMFKQGTYNLKFTAEGFDSAGGRSVVASNSVLISPLEQLVGYKANGNLDFIKTDSERTVEFIAIDKLLNRIDANEMTLTLKEIQRISTLVKQPNGTYKYQTVRKEVEVSNEVVDLSKTGYRYSINNQLPGEFLIEIFDQQKRRLSRVAFSVAGFANLSGKIDKKAELKVTLNKRDYLPGEMIEMSIRAPYAGAGLITIETDRVHHHQWFKAAEESSVQRIQIPKTLEGSGYVNVSFIRDISSKEIFTSPLSYAVQPFSIDKSKRRIDISLSAPDIARPGKPMDISFKTSKPSRVALFAVDEGVLQVASYQTPDPLSHFFKKQALAVETLQILDLILPDFNIVKEASASGGGSAALRSLAKNLNPFSRKTDKPAVYWSGIYDSSSEPKKVTFDVPNTFAGELRVIAVAVGETSVGAASMSSLVRGPFVISPNLLTHAAPDDEFMVTVGVANLIEGSGVGAQVNLSVTASEHLKILGDSRAELFIDEGSENKYQFKVKANNRLGAAELIFKAQYKGEDSTRTASMSVRPATTYYTSLESGYHKDETLELESLRPLYADLAEQSISASASPLVIVGGLNAYLNTFPHGCTEQVVSKVFPLVGLMSHPAYAPHIKEVKTHFTHLISKLRERQLGDGGFAFWPGHNRSARYPSIYVMHFLLEANEQGFPIPQDILQRGKDYLSSYVMQPGNSLADARDRANAIYLLTRMGEVTTNFLVDLEENLLKKQALDWGKDILSVYMAATYQLLQKDQEASRLVTGYQLGSSHKELNDLRSPLANDAQYLYLLTKHFESKTALLSGDKIFQLTEKISRGEYNTISAAYSILALGAYSKSVLANDFKEKIKFNKLVGDGSKVNLPVLFAPFPKATYDVDAKGIIVEGNQPLFYLNAQSGFNRSTNASAIRQGIELSRSFIDDKGNEVTRFEQGKELTVKLKVRALGGKSLTNIAIVDLLPGGFEIIRSSVARTAYNWRADYVDIREDRLVYYGSFDNSVKELTYKVKLTSAGDFIIPSSYAESMYDRSIRAVTKAGKFTVSASQ